ncbi:MAG TPA: APC family permease, partial [Candidatus Acidoferrales bacterium]|nr:APC family permease [Candidatus Acidoferrales bacterium]
PAMWIGILFALLLCLATAVSYAELAKLYPGTGSSYYFAEQSFLNHDKAWRYARLMKFIVGWGSHLYYWIYPGVMVAVTGVFCGYIVGTLWPNFMSAANPGPMFMMLVAVLFSFGVAYIAHRGVTGSTAVSIAINVIQISALVLFAGLAIGYRVGHPPGSVAWQWDATSGHAYNCEFAADAQKNIVRDANMVPQCKMDAAGKPVPYIVSYPVNDPSSGAFLTHPTAKSVIGIHNFGWMFVQATVAILILVGFESVTSLGGEAKNAKRDVPIAVLTSLLVQGAFCYLFEYFAANYFLSSGYPMSTATGSSAPIGDMMIMVGDALFHGHGRAFMLIEAVTVFLALIGTTLSCINTGARVTYAMGKDAEVPEHFGILHEKNLSPHRAIWALAVISAIFGVLALTMLFGDAGALPDATIQALPHGFWSSFGYVSHDTMAKMPNSLLTITLASNFGTFLLYMLSCVTCIFCYKGHPNYNFVKHTLIPYFGIAANLICMGAYIVLPFMGYGTKMEPFLALGIAAVWAIYGGIYFLRTSKATGRTTLVTSRT